MLPKLFVERMREQLGQECEAFLASFEREKYQALRLNALKRRAGGGNAAEESLCFHPEGGDPAGEIALGDPVPWAAGGFYYENSVQPGKHPWHDAGVYYIQEPSAMAPVTLLEAHPREKILDLCAAPGGKSTQIAAAMDGEGLLVSNEIHPARAKILSENIERMGVRNACVTNETPQRLEQMFPSFFDKILVDAPCSGEGMFRKNQAACDEWSPENVQMCADRQDEILDCAANMLRPGGRLVYSTCTFAVAENEGSMERFLERHPEFARVEREMRSGSNLQAMSCGSGMFRLWPHRINGEGHFMAVLEKIGVGDGESAQGENTWENNPAESCKNVGKSRGKDSGRSGKVKSRRDADGEAPEEFLEFFRAEIKESATAGGTLDLRSRKYLKFGDNLYLAPEQLPELRGLKVLRPGLHLGTLKKGRFEPSHALALALAPEEAVGVWNLSSREAAAYLQGQTFPAEGRKGWYLICVDGFSLGWGKLAAGIMKNHYPKGLRGPG